MPTEIPAPLVSELVTERRIAVAAALALVVLSMAFRNDRAMLLGTPAVGDRDAAAFSALVAPPVVSGPALRASPGPLAGARRFRPRAPGIGPIGERAATPGFVSPGAGVGGPDGAAGPVFALDTVGAASRGGTYTAQPANFIGLPGGVIFGSAGATTPTNPTTPTDPTGPIDPTTPTDPTTPDPGPGAVPEPTSWAFMILGIGVVGASLRRRRRAAGPAAATALAAA